MMKTGLGFWVAALVLVGSLTGCGGDEASAATSAADSSASGTSGVIDRTSSPSITGNPSVKAVAGQAYNFQPALENVGTASVSFNIAHLPAWAKFNSATGQLSGTPTTKQVGQYSGIAISAMVGNTAVALPAFSITVASTGSTDDSSSANAVTLSWVTPTENADGSQLVDLKGFKVHYGAKSGVYTETVEIPNPGLTTYVVQNLEAGKYYVAMTTYNSKGVESSMSPEISTQVVD